MSSQRDTGGFSQYDRIVEGMQVVDLAGDTIGTVVEVVGERPMAVGGRGGEPVGRNQEARRAGEGARGYITVNQPSGPLYIPMTMVNRVEQNRVQLIVDREAIDTLTWGRPPDIDPD